MKKRTATWGGRFPFTVEVSGYDPEHPRCVCGHLIADHSASEPHACLIGSRISKHYQQPEACACVAIEEPS